MKKALSIYILLCFLTTGIIGPMPAFAQEEFRLPAPGVMVHLSPPFDPPILKGIKVHPYNPFRFDFILDKGDSQLSNAALKDESRKLIKYFLASLTIPEKDLWVNLSPYEKDRIIPNSFGLTEMGRDLLAEDYMLKQITASLIYPEDEIGKKFWKRIYEEAAKKFGTTNIPVNTFNKVWIVPEKAVVFENAKAGTAYVVESKLKVMLEQDYLSLEKHKGIQSKQAQTKDTNQLGSQVVREIVIPELTKEVNEDKNFAKLRQVYNSLILATWYKKKIKDSILSQVYADKNKVVGVNIDDPKEKERIYQKYLRAFKKGVYNYIKEDFDPIVKETTPRKYFSGGVSLSDLAMRANSVIKYTNQLPMSLDNAMQVVTTDMTMANQGQAPIDAAMTEQTVDLLGTTPKLGLSPQLLADEIEKEIQNPGSGNIPLIATISDEHGTIDKFDSLLVDMFRSVAAGKKIPSDFKLNSDKTLVQQGINLNDFKGQLFIHNLGDFMDRGPFGEKVFRRSKELIDAGLSDFIIGNHDQWMFMNLIGLHLPYYDGFEFYGYKDSYDSKKGGGNVRFLLAQKHRENPETRKAMWWAKKLGEFRKFHEDQQKKKWISVDVEVNGVNGLFARVTNGMTEDEKQEWYRTDAGKVWNKLRGFDPNVGEVATGVKAVGLVSIVWWEALLKQFESIYTNLYKVHKIGKDTAVQQEWESAINMIKSHVIPDLKETLEEHISPANGQEPQWWWRIFEAINSQNYTSPEWWAEDWVYHKGWGSSVFKEINDTYHGGQQAVTTENYLDEDSPLKGVAVLKEIAQFFKDHYTLHIRDIMQMDLMHAFLPIDPKTGEFYFNYKSRQYQGKGGNGTFPYWEGLNAIAQDVRDAPNNEDLIRAIYESKTVVNGWYADNTTEAKVSHVADAFTNIGVKKIAIANGIHWLITGHLPMHDFLKLTEDRRRVITGHIISTEDGQRGFADSDGGMGEKFGGGGKYLVAGLDGFRLRGFPSKKSLEIVDSPPTIIFKKDTAGIEKEKLVYRNDNSIPAKDFLLGVLNNIRSLTGDLAMQSGEEHSQSSQPTDIPHKGYPLVEDEPIVYENLRLLDFTLHKEGNKQKAIMYWMPRFSDLERIFELAKRMKNNDHETPTVVEIGAGNGLLSYLLAKFFKINVITIEPNKIAVQNAIKVYGSETEAKKMVGRVRYFQGNGDNVLQNNAKVALKVFLRNLGIVQPDLVFISWMPQGVDLTGEMSAINAKAMLFIGDSNVTGTWAAEERTNLDYSEYKFLRGKYQAGPDGRSLYNFAKQGADWNAEQYLQANNYNDYSVYIRQGVINENEEQNLNRFWKEQPTVARESRFPWEIEFEEMVSNGGDARKKFIDDVIPSNRAMNAVKPNGPGGIDLTPANMNLETKTDFRFHGNDKGGIKFHLAPAMLQQLQNARGFVPVIISVHPLKDLSTFLVSV